MCLSELIPVPLPHPLPLWLPPSFFFFSASSTFLFCIPKTPVCSKGLFLGVFNLWQGENHVPMLLGVLGLWSPSSSLAPDTWALSLVYTHQLYCSQSSHVPRVSFLAPGTILWCKFSPNHFCIVLSRPLSYRCCIVPFWLPLRFLSVFCSLLP